MNGQALHFSVPLEVLSNEAEVEARARRLGSLSLSLSVRVPFRELVAFPQGGSGVALGFPKGTKFVHRKLFRLLLLLLPAEQALPSEEAAKSVTDENRVQKHNYSSPGQCRPVGWNLVRYTERWCVQFPVRAHMWVLGLVSSWSVCER